MLNNTSHILIVDDNPENIRVLGTSLGQFDYKMTIALNGKSALKAVEEQRPDLILLDIMMPDMNGFQVCEILKNNSKTQEIEIIFITAAVEQEDELKGLSLGAIDYIHKPFFIPIVQAKVALHLERIHNKRLREDIERITQHDLKTPLNAIMGYPQLMLMDTNLTDEQHNYLEQILRAGNEMLCMINNSLDLFKMERHCYQYSPELVDVVGIIKTIRQDIRMLLEPDNIKITISVEGHADSDDDQFFLVYAERNLTYSLFSNLIRNAIEACSINETIAVKMYQEQQQGVISITNPGEVPTEIRNTFFEKYSTARKNHGTGLGTYSAKLMAMTQQGSISMTTNSKETCITVYLPHQNSL